MQLTKHIGCLLALVFATASAFAGDESVRPNFWFDATLAAELGQGWSGSTGSDYWSFANNVGKLNNMSATGENEYLTFTAEAKELPGDESTIQTSVKFTAMDKADFFTEQGTLPPIPSGAKGGLTIIEDSDTGATEFYGIVSNKWVALLGDTAAALDHQVIVEVKIKENNGKLISYKVGGQALKLSEGGSDDLATDFNGDEIRSVSYRGVCEIASLQGDAKDNLWELTLKTIADATAAITGAEIKEGAGTSTPKIKATRGEVTVTYTAQNDKLFFPIAGGHGETTISSSASVNGNDATTFVDAFEGSVVQDAVAEVVGGGEKNKYASIAAAVAVGNNVNVLQSAAAGFELGKALTLSAETGVTISGDITLLKDGVLTINSGIYTGKFLNSTEENLILMGGTVALAKAVAQEYCGEKRFAKALTEASSLIEEGQAVEAKEGVPAMNVDQEVVTAAGGADKVAAYLKVEAGNGLKRWQNYALGLGTDATVAPTVSAANDSDNNNINIDPSFTELKNAGVAVTYSVKIGDDVATVSDDPYIPLSKISDEGVTKTVVQIYTAGEAAGNPITIGANKVKKPAVNMRTLFTVPWADSATGTGVTVANLFKTAALQGGETIELYNQDADAYVKWVFENGAWVNSTDDIANYNETKLANLKKLSAETETVTKGQALWFTGSADAVQFGVDSTAQSTTPVAAAKWGFAANPISGAAKQLSAIVAPTAVSDAQVQLTDSNGKTAIYFVKDGVWGYNKISGRKRVFEAANPSIAPGQEFWFDNKGDKAANLAW